MRSSRAAVAVIGLSLGGWLACGARAEPASEPVAPVVVVDDLSSAAVDGEAAEVEPDSSAWPSESSSPMQGQLEPSKILTVVRSHVGELRRCYERALQSAGPGLEGKIVVTFVIDEQGRVASTYAASSQFPDEQTVVCVQEVFRQMTFPPPRGGRVTVNYPLIFHPGPAGSSSP